MQVTPVFNGTRGDRRQLLMWSLGLFCFGLVIRLLFAATADVAVPIRGDILGYWTYAGNMLDKAVFSSQQGAAPAPDSFRGPAYPFFLAVCMAIAGDRADALHVATLAQIFIGAALVPIAVSVAAQWLRNPAALACGFMVALWPHLVVFASTLLSETLFALTLLIGLWALSRSEREGDRRLAVVGGAAFGAAYLVNPIVFFFPVLVCFLFHRTGKSRLTVAFVLAFAIPVVCWTARNAALPPASSSTHRALVNLVEGSWPLYHDAHNDEGRNPIALDVANAIRAEEQAMVQDPRAGLRAMGARFAADPSYYLHWYVLKKPYLLWDWGIRIGAGGIYFLETENSPYERNAALKLTETAFRAMNPWLIAMAFASIIGVAARALRRRPVPFPLLLTVVLAAYLTLVHLILQAEPRYAVAYRPLEVMLAATFLTGAIARISAVRNRVGMQGNVESNDQAVHRN
jgi:4-amino-4-deoxy-L-arabinose transferase-like glycosyltransferase